MSLAISRLCAGITPSATLSIDARAKAMKAEGIRVVGFAAGEPDADTPDFIVQAADDAMAKGMTRYTPVPGTVALREAICRKFARDNNLLIKPDEIVVSNGAKHALYNAMVATLNPGDEALLPAPCWVSYPEMVRMAGGVPVFVPTDAEHEFCPTMEAFEAALTQRTKLIVLNSPNNPTGAVYPPALLRQIADFAVQNGLWVISDEIYEKLVYDGYEQVSIASFGDAIRAQTIIVNGVSKSYAMTGWRIGYTVAPLAISKAMGAFQSHATSNPNSIAQHASIAAIDKGEAFATALCHTFDGRRNAMLARIRSIEGLSCPTPHGAFYVMLDVTKLIGRSFHGKPIADDMTLSAMLLEEAKVAVVPGTPFEAPGFLRLSYALSQADIDAGLDAIEAFVKQLS